MKCINCKHLHIVVPQFDQPHGEIVCGKQHFDGATTEELYEDHPVTNECPDYQQQGSVSGRNFFVSSDSVKDLIETILRKD